MRKEKEFYIKQLPSGYWSVWVDNNWVEASLPTKEKAEELMKRLIKKGKMK